jgi:hypothetical protein
MRTTRESSTIRHDGMVRPSNSASMPAPLPLAKTPLHNIETVFLKSLKEVFSRPAAD